MPIYSFLQKTQAKGFMHMLSADTGTAASLDAAGAGAPDVVVSAAPGRAGSGAADTERREAAPARIATIKVTGFILTLGEWFGRL